MKADEMFKELGYSKKVECENVVIYTKPSSLEDDINYEIKISWLAVMKTFGEAFRYLDPDEVKAAAKKLEEMGL